MKINKKRIGIAVAGVLALAFLWQTAEAQGKPWNKIDDPTRFQTLSSFGDNAVLDRETGMIWVRSASSSGNNVWNDAVDSCHRGETTGIRRGWRLPTVEELESLCVPGVINPNEASCLPVGHPFLNVGTAFYWSSSHFPGISGNVYVKRFAGPELTTPAAKDQTHSTWCVRGGNGYDSGH